MSRQQASATTVPAYADELFTQSPGRVYREAMAVLEQALLSHALALTGGNQLRAARLLGLNRNTLRKRCRQLGLMPPPEPRATALPTDESGDRDLPPK